MAPPLSPPSHSWPATVPMEFHQLNTRHSAFKMDNNTVPTGHSGEARGQAVQWICVSAYLVAAVVIMLRVYVRGFMVRFFGADDWFILVGFAITGLNTGLSYAQVRAGLGRHQWETEHIYLVGYMKAAWPFMILYGIGIWAIKMSVLLLYHRLAPTRAHKRVIKVIILIVTLFTIAVTISQVFQCKPFLRSIDPHFPDGCIQMNELNISISSFSVLSDAVILFLPLGTIKVLQIDRKRKIALYCIFCVGFFALVAAAGRLGALVVWTTSTDPMWSFSPVVICTHLETCVGLITASLPSLNPLFKKIIAGSRKIITSPTGTGGRSPNIALGNISKSDEGYNVRVKSNSKALGMSRLGGESEETIIGTGKGGELRQGEVMVDRTVEVKFEYDRSSSVTSQS